MKLSELKAMVAAIECNASETNPDPEVSFWLTTEVENQVKAVYPMRGTFIDCAINPEEFKDGGLHQHRTRERNFSIPLVPVVAPE